MVTFLLGVLALECLAMLGWGMLRRARMIEFPFLASAVFFGWVLPQLIGPTRAAELIYTGRIIDAREADSLGLLNALVDIAYAYLDPRVRLGESASE